MNKKQDTPRWLPLHKPQETVFHSKRHKSIVSKHPIEAVLYCLRCPRSFHANQETTKGHNDTAVSHGCSAVEALPRYGLGSRHSPLLQYRLVLSLLRRTALHPKDRPQYQEIQRHITPIPESEHASHQTYGTFYLETPYV